MSLCPLPRSRRFASAFNALRAARGIGGLYCHSASRAIDERLPESGLALAALHEVGGGGSGTVHGAAAATLRRRDRSTDPWARAVIICSHPVISQSRHYQGAKVIQWSVRSGCCRLEATRNSRTSG